MQANRVLRIIYILVTAAVGMLVSTVARSESAKEDPRNLFREGRRLVASGYYQAACRKFEKSLQLEPGMGTEFNLADCWERLGRTASARKLFLKVAAAAMDQNQDKRSQAALERADSLLTRLSRLQLQCESSCPAEIRVLRAGIRLEQSSWQDPVEVDPGLYRVEANVPHGITWSTQVVVPNDPGIIVVSVPSLQVQPKTGSITGESDPAPAPARTLLKRTTRAASPLTTLASSDGPTTTILPTALLLVGAGGLVLGGASALVLNHKNGQASEICPTGDSCTQSEIDQHGDLVGDARLARIGVYTGLGLGVASIAAAGIAHYLMHPQRKERDPTRGSVQFLPVVGGNGPVWGATARGSW